MELPLEINTNGVGLSAGDTTYLLLNPIWDESYGFQTPIEISIAEDGHIFIADSAANSIFILEQDGDILGEFQDLQNIFIDNKTISPIDVDIDKKMNVFFIDGSEKVYVWNQYWNDIGIDSISNSGTFIHAESGVSQIIESGSALWIDRVNMNKWILSDIVWKEDLSLIDSLLHPHIFFDGTNPTHTINDIYYSSEASQFSGISAQQDGSNVIYATDILHDRIIRIDFFKTHYLKLSTGRKIWAYEGHYSHNACDRGSGLGTVDNPLGIDVDDDGNIYYCQSGDGTALGDPSIRDIHKIVPDVTGAFSFDDEWDDKDEFDEFIHDIVDPTRFFHPEDIAVDKNQTVYVANTNAKEIQVFNSQGDFFRKAGVESATIDSLTWESWDVQGPDTLLIDTLLYKVEIKGALEKPRAVTVDRDGVIYICDTPSSSILRYQRSDQLDEFK